MPQPAVRKTQKAQLQSFALAGAPKARTAYVLYLRDQYHQFDQAGLTNRQRISSISRSWKVLSPEVKDKYREMALEESKMRQKHIETKINELSMPLSSLSEVSENEACSVATPGNFVLEYQPQIGELLAARHKVLQWKALVKLNNNKSNELQILRDICSQPKFRGTGVMQPIEWDDSSCSPRWLAFEYVPRTLQACLAVDGASAAFCLYTGPVFVMLTLCLQICWWICKSSK